MMMKNHTKAWILTFWILYTALSANIQTASGQTFTIEVESIPVFQDTENNPYRESIEYLHNKGVIQGYSKGRDFRPDQTINRAAFLKMMLANYGFEPQEDKVIRIKHPFKDIAQKTWFEPYFQRAWELGIVEDTSKGEPSKPITRLEASEFLLKLLEINPARWVDEEEWPLTYQDVSPNAWFAGIIASAEKHGLLEHIHWKNSFLKPRQEITRGEAAQFLYNTDLFLVEQDLLTELKTALLEKNGTLKLPHFDIFLDVWNRVNADHYKAHELDQEGLMYGAIKGLVKSLDDPYSVFLDPPEASDYNESLEGKFGGIGVMLEKNEDGKMWIQGFLIDSPGEKAGLQYHDRLIGVDGATLEDNTNIDLIRMVRGEVGTPVDITVERDGVDEPLTFTIVRELIDLATMEGKFMDGALYIDINVFDSEADTTLKKTIDAQIAEHPDFKGFILDLRNNDGGYLDSLINMVGYFVPSDQPMGYLRFLDEPLREIHPTGDGEWQGLPMVILMNGGSASAAEFMAIALQEANGAKLVGEKSYGKGVGQSLTDYEDQSTLKLTIMEWFSPNKNNINKIGILPDYEVKRTLEDLKNNVDPQLDKALEVFEEISNFKASMTKKVKAQSREQKFLFPTFP